MHLLSRHLLILSLLVSVGDVRGQEPPHPLDALTPKEYWAVFEAMKESGRVDSLTRYAGVSLREPPKVEVLRWKPGQVFSREALVVVKQQRRTFEAVVDVPSGRIASWSEMKGVQPNLTREEWEDVEKEVEKHPEWREAMRRRGIRDFETVGCGGPTPGYFGTAEEDGRRLQKVVCWERRGTWYGWGRPIEGLTILWDADERRVVRIADSGPVRIPTAPEDYDVSSVGPLRDVPTPISVEQPLGPSFRVEGHRVSWQNWRRVGLVVSDVRYVDAGRSRSVLYQGHLSEIFVPYMDPSDPWYAWTYLDLGEFSNIHGLATSLERGSDCPENAVYFDGYSADEWLMPQRMPRAACLFERYAGDFAWRHRDGPDEVESRRRRDLVLRMIATVGNYDYVFDWIFQQDGTLRVVAGATGINAVKAVVSRNARDGGGDADAYGRFIAENIVSVNHDHFFSFRLDLDVDGTVNSLICDNLETQRLPDGHPRRSLWTVRTDVVRSEKQGRLDISMAKPALWRVVNPAVTNALGYPVSYQLKPGHNAMSLLASDDFPQRRAGFTAHQLWVTPQRDDERHAAGDYVTQSRGEGGLPTWTLGDRQVENTDLVLWYTLGFHHVPRAEDWPVMPAAWHEFELRPFDFFARNPALDLPQDR
jgi:primary-amine oxidase